MLRKIRLGSWIALGVFILYAAVVGGGLCLDRVHCPYGPSRMLLETFGYVLSFPIVLLDLAIDPEGTIGLVMFILAAVANCYLWGYCIEWIIGRRRRS